MLERAFHLFLYVAAAYGVCSAFLGFTAFLKECDQWNSDAED